jgi:DNA-binding Lrp family transcriptional regulator
MDKTLDVKISGVTTAEIHEELLKNLASGIPDDGFALQGIASDTTLSCATVRRRLEEYLENGVLDTDLRVVDHTRQRVYWFNDTDNFERDYQNLVDDLSPHVPSQAISIQGFAEDLGVSEQTAARHLNSLVEDGVFKTKIVPLNGTSQRIYWRPYE